MNVIHYDPIRKTTDGKLELTCVKKVEFNLQPYGKFTIKWKTRQGHIPNIIPFDELHIKHDTTMPLTLEQDKEVIKYMKKYKTDILTDGNYFYTRAGNGITEIYHKKLEMYRDDVSFKNVVDNGDSWSTIMISNAK